ncbi:MAG: hypothetical protein HOD37_10660 [Bacteroidetes bacterium]|nr:hypothetical protein [Bacteroidota bacterium]
MPEILLRHCPPESAELLQKWLANKKIQIRISRSRMTKLGDFRPPHNSYSARISVNHDLHPMEFLITLAHEIAHYDVFAASGFRIRTRRSSIKPHGVEWKEVFRGYIREVIIFGNKYIQSKDEEREDSVWNYKVLKALQMCYLERERIASTPCPELKKILENGENDKLLRVQDLDEGTVFTIRNGRSFIMGKKLRTRYRCKEVRTQKTYTLHPLAEVIKKKNIRL